MLFFLLLGLTGALYLPGVAPHSFFPDDPVELKVNGLTSTRTQLPFDYFSLPLCKPLELKNDGENLGEVLLGDRIQNSKFDIRFLQTEECKILCVETADTEARKTFKTRIEEDYHGHWIIDNLPAATIWVSRDRNGETVPVYVDGFPLGRIDENGEVLVHNHVDILIKYHGESQGYNIVAVEVVPHSVGWKLPTSVHEGSCPEKPGKALSIDDVNNDLVFTYSVKWQDSPDIKWAYRWDAYLKMTNSKIQWFYISNSLVAIALLSFMIGLILLRTLRQDLATYNKIALEDDEQEDTGWKLVHGDVMRPPHFPMALSVLVGSGVQVILSTCVTLTFAMFGFLSPAYRGGLLTVSLVLFVVMGVHAGYSSARLYKNISGKAWKKNAMMTAFLFPGVCFGMFFILNFFIWGEKSSGAVHWTTLLGLVALWMFVHIPLTFVGSYFGYKKQKSDPPVRTNQIPRQIPPQPWYNMPTAILMGGIMPFGCVFVELYYILTSLWLHRFVYIFGFFFLVFVILIVTCSEISIIMVYFQLCTEDYHWWWRSFLTSASSSFYMFLYSCFFFRSLHMTKIVSGMLYFGYTFILCFAFFCMTGAVGFYAAYYFVWKIYGAIKVD